jgi:transposase
MTIKRDHVPKDQLSIMAKIEHDISQLRVARLFDRFCEIMRQKKTADLGLWMAAAIDSPLNSFAKGIIADRDTVRAANIQSWSNGQTKGQIIKLVRRSDVGVCKKLICSRRVSSARRKQLQQSGSEPNLRAD